jgi:hypothetical protein
MEFKKGEVLKVVKKSGYVDVEDKTDIVTVQKIIRRNGITRVHVWSNMGHGYTILLEEFLSKWGTIEKVTA